MIIYPQNHRGAYAGAHTVISRSVVLTPQTITATTAGGSSVLISQARGLHRGVFSRTFGRVN